MKRRIGLRLIHVSDFVYRHRRWFAQAWFPLTWHIGQVGWNLYAPHTKRNGQDAQ